MIWILTIAATVYGQQAVDYILKARAFTEGGKPDQAINLLNRALSETKESYCLTKELKLIC